jgi:hypothetical protein
VIATPREVSVADLQPAGSPRSPGLHVSQVLKSILVKLEPERFGGEMDWTKIELGFAVEALIEHAFRDRQQDILRLGELWKDEIAGTPDGMSFHDGTLIIHEIKCTWMSSTDCPDHKKFAHWIWQIKSYCHMAETCHARLHVFFVNGNYKDSRSPEYKEWDLLFSPSELEENWMMVLNAARSLRVE